MKWEILSALHRTSNTGSGTQTLHNTSKKSFGIQSHVHKPILVKLGTLLSTEARISLVYVDLIYQMLLSREIYISDIVLQFMYYTAHTIGNNEPFASFSGFNVS